MVKISIGNAEKDLGDIEESWITQQVNRRRADGVKVLVRVIVKEGDMNVVLTTPSGRTREGKSRPPRPREEALFNLWNQHGLNNDEFSVVNLITFLRQLKSIV
ncbi:MAG: hypothetical protein C4542_01640 [Dehalococcoidia bacterium]|nr:MAG: hypothetical protein C4542_01640 [Dehalococcoidia bacterium]